MKNKILICNRFIFKYYLSIIMVFLFILSAILLLVPSVSLVTGNASTKGLSLINILLVIFGVLLFSLATAELLGRAFFYFTH